MRGFLGFVKRFRDISSFTIGCPSSPCILSEGTALSIALALTHLRHSLKRAELCCRGSHTELDRILNPVSACSSLKELVFGISDESLSNSGFVLEQLGIVCTANSSLDSLMILSCFENGTLLDVSPFLRFPQSLSSNLKKLEFQNCIFPVHNSLRWPPEPEVLAEVSHLGFFRLRLRESCERQLAS